jgi:hypothetical protein
MTWQPAYSSKVGSKSVGGFVVATVRTNRLVPLAALMMRSPPKINNNKTKGARRSTDGGQYDAKSAGSNSDDASTATSIIWDLEMLFLDERAIRRRRCC